MSAKQEKLLWEHADRGNVAEIELLLATGVDANAADSFGFTALEYALNSYPHLPDKDHLATVSALVERGADVNARSHNGQTPLFTAAAEGLFEVVEYLFHHGADLSMRLDTGATAFHEIPDGIINRPMNFTVTVTHGDETITLTDPEEIRQAIGSHPDDEYQARLKTAQFLIDNGIDLNAQLYESGQTALFRAADLGAAEIVTLILATGNIAIDHIDKWGLTALHYACRRGHLDIVEQLVAAGAHINAQEAYGFIPLHEAAENGHLAIVQLLVKHGADAGLGIKRSFQNYPAGSTALDIAGKSGKKKVVNFLSKL